MKTEHLITPPPELVQRWVIATESNDCIGALPTNFEQRAARRPIPPSLKEQALALLEPQGSPARLLNEDQMGILRRALEQLDD